MDINEIRYLSGINESFDSGKHPLIQNYDNLYANAKELINTIEKSIKQEHAKQNRPLLTNFLLYGGKSLVDLLSFLNNNIISKQKKLDPTLNKLRTLVRNMLNDFEGLNTQRLKNEEIVNRLQEIIALFTEIPTGKELIKILASNPFAKALVKMESPGENN